MGGGTSRNANLQSRSANANKSNNSNKNAVKVPLHAALRATVLIQKRVRVMLALNLLIRLKEQKRIQDGAALRYLLNLQEKIHDQKSSPTKQTVDKFSNVLALFNNNEVLETINGNKIDKEDCHSGNRLTRTTMLINPLIGFVVKSKTVDTGRKVFINICHHELLVGASVKFSSPRLLNNTVTDNGVFDLNFESSLVFDVLISSTEYHEQFHYKQSLGVVTSHNKVKNKLSEMAIGFLNSFEHVYSAATPHHSSSHSPTKKEKGKKQSASDSETGDFKVSTAYKIPKIRRGYVGELLPLVLDLHSVHLLHSFLKPADKPVKGTKKYKGLSSIATLTLPPLVRGWVSLPVQSLENNGSTGDGRMYTRGSFDLTRSGSDLGTRYSEPTVEEYSGSVVSATVTLPADNKNQKKLGNHDLSDDEEEGGGLDETQKEYLKRVNALQCGLAAYLTLNHGLLIVYNSINLMPVSAQTKPEATPTKNKPNTVERVNTTPYGKDEYLRLLLCDYQASTLIDHANGIFYVQLMPTVMAIEPVNPQDRLLGLLSNRYPSSGDRSDSELTVQCKSYAEMLTWKLLFAAHIEYAQQRQTQLQASLALSTTTTVNSQDMSVQPARQASWLVRRVSHLSSQSMLSGVLRGVTQRVFSVLALGVLNIYGSDASEDSLLESIPLSGRVVEMTRGAVDPRTDTLDVVITLRSEVLSEANETHEFCYLAVSAQDEEPFVILDVLQRHIRYACCYAGAYLLPLVEFNHRLTLAPSDGAERKNVSIGVVTMESCFREYVPLKKVVVEEVFAEEEEVNSDDDEVDEEEEEMKRKAAAELLLQQQRARIKPFNGVREHIFRCVASTTRDYDPRSDLNQFPSSRNEPLTANNAYDLVMAENRLCIYKALCHIATINLQSPENVELATIIEENLSDTAALNIETPTSSPQKSSAAKTPVRLEESKATTPATSKEMYTAWQIVVVATNSLKYRLGFRCEQDYLSWLKVIDGRGQCVENKIVIVPPESVKKRRKIRRRTMRKGGNQRSPGTTSVSEMSQNGSDDEDEDMSDEGSVAPGTGSVSPMHSPKSKRRTMNDTGDCKVDDSSSDKEDGEVGDAELVRAHGNSKTASTLANFQNKLNIKGTNPLDATANNLDNNATKKYSRLMRPKESVVAAGVVLKHEVKSKSGSFSPASTGTRRILLLTDLPRLIFIDPVSNIIRGHIELSKTARIEYKTTNASDFEITVAGTTSKFTASDGPAKDAKFWVYKMKVATGK